MYPHEDVGSGNVWETSPEYDRTYKNADYTTGIDDVGEHVVRVYVEDSSRQNDYQDITVTVT